MNVLRGLFSTMLINGLKETISRRFVFNYTCHCHGFVGMFLGTFLKGKANYFSTNQKLLIVVISAIVLRALEFFGIMLSPSINICGPLFFLIC
jgi:hypothetical protein